MNGDTPASADTMPERRPGQPIAIAAALCALAWHGGGIAAGDARDDGAGEPSDAAVTLVLDALPVSGAEVHTQQSPLAVHGGAVYVANIEPGPNGDVDGLDLVTVVRRGTPDGSGEWRWTSNTIDRRTAFDRWHTAPGIGIDERGYVHVAWNMHNLPWQYGVSTKPDSIADFEYRGQPISDAELRRYKVENRTRFPAPGSAAIPGTQITYPAFANDPRGRLWVTYRFAGKPNREFEERMMSSGVARYDAESREWTAVGGVIDLAPGDYEGPAGDAARLRALAGEDGWTSYLPRLAFGENGRMSISMLWREGIAGEELTHPCLLVSDDADGDASGGAPSFRTMGGEPVALPATPRDCGPLDDGEGMYYSMSAVAADSTGTPRVVLSLADGGRVLYSFEEGEWRSEPTPWAASELFFDAHDNAWAIATGPHVFVRPKGETEWHDVWSVEGGTGCRPRAVLDRPADVAWIYTMGCEENVVSVYRAELERLLPGS